VLEEAMRLDLKNILILEDDIQFSRRISQYGKQAIEALDGMDWTSSILGIRLKRTQACPPGKWSTNPSIWPISTP
jgi:GR25 family glycosyltransferase involved in LPS biosynthesis